MSGRNGEGRIPNAQRLWIGNLNQDLTVDTLNGWITKVGYDLLNRPKLVAGQSYRVREAISYTECPYPHPTVTPNLAVLSVRTCSRNCRDARVTGVMMAEEMISDTECPHPPPSPQIFQNLLWLNMFGLMPRSLASALIRCPSVSTPRPSHELSLHLLV